MAARSFVHLHCHSHYSLLDGANRIPELVAHVKKHGMNAVALTDHGNLYGAIEFYRECSAAGINPVIGYEAYVAPGKRNEREARRRGDAGFHLTLLAKDNQGYRNLIKMASLAFLEGYHYVPRIDKELLAAHKDGLICLSGCASSEFSEYILKDQLDEAKKIAEWFAKTFGSNFYVEIQNNGLDIQKRCAEGAIAIANQLGLPLVATSDAHYLKQEDNLAHDVLLCINTGRTRKDENRMRYGSDQFYVRPPEEMYKLFPGRDEAVRRSQEIADSVHVQLDFKKRHFPVFTPPESKKPEDYLRELCEQGLRERYGDAPPSQTVERLNHELNIICRLGFASYFLIVWDFVRFATEHKIPASARGSACGAIVSYVLKLSHVCPLEYDLLFERFLDPNRSEAPDIDIDFCQDGREKVIAYVRQKYGEGSVAQIATFGTMAARAAIKDVGRVLEVPLEHVTRLTNMIPKTLGITLEESLEQSPDLKREYDTDPTIHELLDIAMKLEGTNRNAGTHAAGVVIANGPLTDYVPLHRVIRKGDDSGSKRDEAVITTQWVMGDLEKVGLLKMDFLGLRTLTLLENCLDLIQKTHGDNVPEPKSPDGRIDLYRLPPNDEATYKLLQRGDAKGVFQLESDGIRELLKRMKPDNIRDIVAIMALYRPGPLGGGMVDAYVNRKHGREQPHYPHPVMEEILSETYGVMTYQEQIMRILNRLGGIELSSAYACIKAISKKKHDIIDQRRAEFLRGAQERGVSEATAKEIFDLITFFGGYGFNKCLVGSTTITDAITGEVTTVGALFRKRPSFTIHALNDQEKLVPRQVTDVVWNGRKPVFKLVTAQGKTITATANHPFRTLNGWTNLGDLKSGDAVAATRHLARVANSDIFWDRVVSIEPAGIEDTFDLTVAVDHNFVANGLIVHNSHTAAYAQLGYQTAYLKANYTPEFMAALLSSEVEDGNKRDILVEHFDDARKLGYPIQPPHINESEDDFTVANRKILFGLVAIKGLGRGAAREIVRIRREEGPFKDLFDFSERIDLKIVPRSAVERLIKVGAFDCLGARRAQLMHVLPRALQSAQEVQQDRKHGQLNLFETVEQNGTAESAAQSLPDVPEWPPVEKLKYEKEALDFYISSHPLAQFDQDLSLFSSHRVAQLATLEAGQEVFVGGMLTQLRYQNTKKARNGNSRYVRCKLEDMSGAVECVMWPDDFVRYKDAVQEDAIRFVAASVEKTREEPGLIIQRVLSVDQGKRERTTGVNIMLRLEEHHPRQLANVVELLKQARGGCPVFLFVYDQVGRVAKLRIGEEFRVNPAQLPKERLEAILGPNTVAFSRHSNGSSRNGK